MVICIGEMQQSEPQSTPAPYVCPSGSRASWKEEQGRSPGQKLSFYSFFLAKRLRLLSKLSLERVCVAIIHQTKQNFEN